MVKLYKHIGNEVHYWECWENTPESVVVHWGVVGQRGESKVLTTDDKSGFRQKAQEEIHKNFEDGYEEFDEDELATLIIEFPVNGHGTIDDLEKRHLLEQKMDEILGWTGLGYCDGGSMGSGTMEVFCIVVDFKIAENVIKQSLNNTVFGNYLRVFKQN